MGLLVASAPAFSTGVPVVDAASVLQLQQSYSMLKQQADQLKSQYDAVTRSYGRGASGLSDSIDASSIVPGSWQDVVSQQKSGVYGGRQAAYEKVMNTMSPDSFQDKAQGSNYKMSTDSVRATMAGGESLYDEAQTHLQNFQSLAHQVDSTANVKDAADLQNRMTGELGMAQAAQTKLQALNANLVANQVNESNQATAARTKFFDTPSK
ncbi:Minor pilin of type IV secretion complex (VirB5) [Caballeronia sordidicola]|uniref:Minor pilin of type IV secretion complex (VirB5) n=1 Tax=Caballeronia sordidicola TaxID=196367 RepID=A0A242N493_CABSO|nr:Minor pilin of type IV secretion complex (VirB5) [Caballeronia sordidicola]